MSDEGLRLLIESLGSQVVGSQSNPAGAVALLISETIKFRDKLKAETGAVLTVGDTRAALDALELCLGGQPPPEKLTPEQKALLQIWVDRLLLFRS